MGGFLNWILKAADALITPNPSSGDSALDSFQAATAGIGAAAHNDAGLQSLQLQRQSRQANRDFALRQQLAQSQLADQNLRRQQLQQEVSNYQTPAQKADLDVATAGRLADVQQQHQRPELLPVTNSDGTVSYMQQSFDPTSKSYQISPAMAEMTQTLSSPNAVRPPYAPDAVVTRLSRVPLTSTNPKFAELQYQNQLELQREIALATNPDVKQGKINVAAAEGRARANFDATLARGSNAALANVPPHLIAPATEAATKAGQEYAQAKSVSDRLAAMMDAARNGNVVSYQLIPQEGALQIVTSQGIHRINMAEVQNYGGGSLWDKMVGHIGKALTGQSIPSNVLKDMGEMQQIQADGARSKYQNSLRTINQNYGSSFQPVEMDSLGASNRGTPSTPATPPSGATMKVPGSDGKLHWSDGKNDLGVVQP